MTKRSEAQIKADQEYRTANPGVLVRFSLDELEEIDAARGEDTRPEWIKARAIGAAKRRAPPPSRRR